MPLRIPWSCSRATGSRSRQRRENAGSGGWRADGAKRSSAGRDGRGPAHGVVNPNEWRILPIGPDGAGGRRHMATGAAGTAGIRRAGGNGDAGTPGRPVPHRFPPLGASCGPGIVWIAAWPKSGTSWLRAVLTSYLREDGGPVSINALIGRLANHRETFNEYLGVDSSDMTDEEVARYLPRFREVLVERLFAARPPPERRRNEPGFVKTHEAYRVPGGAPRFPRAGCAGVVYLVRTPWTSPFPTRTT